jgi:hypothetical protein
MSPRPASRVRRRPKGMEPRRKARRRVGRARLVAIM